MAVDITGGSGTSGGQLNLSEGSPCPSDSPIDLSGGSSSSSGLIGGGGPCLTCFKYTNILWVDPNGNDATGVVGDIFHPWKTIKGAEAIAESGDLVYIRPATYNESGIGKDGVSYYAEPGTVISASSYIFTDQGKGAINFKLRWDGTMNMVGTRGVALLNEGSEVTAHIENITGSGRTTAFDTRGGWIYATFNNLDTYDASNRGFVWDIGTQGNAQGSTGVVIRGNRWKANVGGTGNEYAEAYFTYNYGESIVTVSASAHGYRANGPCKIYVNCTGLHYHRNNISGGDGLYFMNHDGAFVSGDYALIELKGNFIVDDSVVASQYGVGHLENTRSVDQIIRFKNARIEYLNSSRALDIVHCQNQGNYEVIEVIDSVLINRNDQAGANFTNKNRASIANKYNVLFKNSEIILDSAASAAFTGSAAQNVLAITDTGCTVPWGGTLTNLHGGTFLYVEPNLQV